MRETMTPRERWLAVLGRQKPDRVPMDYWGTDETTARLMRHLGCADEWEMYARLHIDRLVVVQPRYAGPPRAPGCDVYGCQHVEMDYGSGVYRECVGHPLAGYRTIEEIQAHYTWPSVDSCVPYLLPSSPMAQTNQSPSQAQAWMLASSLLR